MESWSNMLSVFEAKGWHLYRAFRSSDLSSLVAQGKAEYIERDVPYVLLPSASRHDDLSEVAAQVCNARQTNQLPSYRDKKHSVSQIEFVTISEKGLNIKKKDSPDVLFIGAAEMENAVKFNLSTYNVHFFTSIDELRKFIFRQGWREQTPTALPAQLRWEYVHVEAPSEKVTILPSNPSPVLFRGQTQRYSPCRAGCVREVTVSASALKDLSEKEQASVILNLVRTEWFNDNLRQTAAMRWMSRQKIVFDETAVAQHYGLLTGYIDLSQSFDVSAFFACCEIDPSERKWRPVSDGVGVIYVVDVRHPKCGNVRPICLQAFPRPSEQWGWVCEIIMGQDFDMFPHVRKLLFKHDVVASKRVLDQFDNGAALFPPDPLSEVANTIIKSDCLPKSVAERVVRDLIKDSFGLPDKTAESVLAMVEREMDIRFSEAQSVLIMNSVMNQDIDKVWADRLSSGKDIEVRLVRSRNTDV